MSWWTDMCDVMITGKRSKLTPLDQSNVDAIYTVATNITAKIDAALIKPTRPLITTVPPRRTASGKRKKR